MNIKSAQYLENEFKKGTNISIKANIDDVELIVPIDPANRHYAAILEWAEEDGNEIAAAD